MKCAVCSAHLEVYSVRCVVFSVKCAVYSTEQCVVYRVKLCVCPPAQREPPCSLAQTRLELKVWLPLFMAPVHYGTLWNWPQLLEDVHTESLLRRRPGCCGFLCALSPHLKRSLVSGTRVFQTECKKSAEKICAELSEVNLTNPFIFRTNPVIFKTSPFIFKTNPFTLRENQSYL